MRINILPLTSTDWELLYIIESYSTENQEADWNHLMSWSTTVCVSTPCILPTLRMWPETRIWLLYISCPDREERKPRTGIVKESRFIYSLDQNWGRKILSFPTSRFQFYRKKKKRNKFRKVHICLAGYVIIYQSSETLSWREVLSYLMALSYCFYQGTSWRNFNSLETIPLQLLLILFVVVWMRNVSP